MPAGGPVNFTGLTAGHTYYFELYYNIATATVNVVNNGTAASSLQYQSQTLNGDGNVALGVDVTAATPSSGTGGGSGGGGGVGCFSGNVRINTPDGWVRFDELPRDRFFPIKNKSGVFPARLIVHEHFHEVMLDMGHGELVTMGHVMVEPVTGAKIPAVRLFCDAWPGCPFIEFVGTVYNLSVDGPDHTYELENGHTARNIKIPA